MRPYLRYELSITTLSPRVTCTARSSHTAGRALISGSPGGDAAGEHSILSIPHWGSRSKPPSCQPHRLAAIRRPFGRTGEVLSSLFFPPFKLKLFPAAQNAALGKELSFGRAASNAGRRSAHGPAVRGAPSRGGSEHTAPPQPPAGALSWPLSPHRALTPHFFPISTFPDLRFSPPAPQQRFPGSRTAEPRQTQRFHQQKSRAAGAGTVPRAVPALPTPRSPSGTQRQVCHTAPRRTQRLRAAKPHPSSSQELSPAAPLPASLQHCTAHCSSLRVQADARLCFSMRGHTLSYKGNLFRLRKLM